MRKQLGIVLTGGLIAFAIAQTTSGPGLLASFGKALFDAKSLSATYTSQVIGGPPAQYQVVLKKPNLIRVETPTNVIVGDGKQVTTYDKAAKTYYKQPETDAVLREIFGSGDLALYAGFFDAQAYKAASARPLGPKTRRGQTLNAVEARPDGTARRIVTYYLAADNVARQATVDADVKGEKQTVVFDVKELSLDGNLGNETFAFNAPSDARELTLAEMNASKWFTDLNEAKKIATATNKPIFVDFMAVWCGPCKMLDREVFQTEQFKKLAAKMVLLKIDVDAQPAVSQMYNIEAMPTQMLLDKNGAVISSTVGYGGPAAFYSWINGALGR